VDLVAQKIDRGRAAAAGAEVVKVRRIPGLKRWNRGLFVRRSDRIARRYEFVIGHGHHREQDVLVLHNSIRLANERVDGDGAAGDDPDARLQDTVIGAGRFTACIANSGLMRDDLLERYGVAPEKVHVVYPGCDTARFNGGCRERYRLETRRTLGVPDGRLLIGLVTSGAFKKRGVDILLKAYARIPEKVRESTKLLIVGRPSPGPYRELADSLGIGADVLFQPAVFDVERYYAALDIGVHPARFEEFGLTAQEMMACGVPVITNRRVGAAELLPAPVYRQLPSDADPGSLAAQLEAFVRDPALRRRWSEDGMAAAAANSLEVNFERTLAVCREAGL
jgi:UDP-glucose:(heptosyl)LPS alpha-1,3-glucosyltransferase